MGRKPLVGLNGIKQAALSVFLEKGYDGASMRDIAEAAGCSVGLTYNYYKTKDDVFSGAMEVFFAGYEADFESIARQGERNPFQVMTNFFTYIEVETIKFRKKFAEKIHWTIRWAIRERMLVLIERYIRRIVETLTEWGAEPPLNLSATTALLAHGIGGIILREEQGEYLDKRDDVRRGTNLIMGLAPEFAELNIPYSAADSHLAGCLGIIESEKARYPHFGIQSFSAAFGERARGGEILVVTKDDSVAGFISFDRKNCFIDCLAVDGKYSGRGVEMRLLVTALSKMPVGSRVTAQVLADNAESAAFYRAMGFAAGETFNDFGCRCIRFARTVPESAAEIVRRA